VEIFIKNQKANLNPKDVIGEGGEAKIFSLNNLAVKIYHDNMVTEKRGNKLRSFPRNLPEKLIGPIDLASDKKDRIVGFTMKMLKDAECFLMLSNIRYRSNFPNEKVMKIFKDALQTLKNIHNQGIVVGDLNDLNLMFKTDEAFYIDADSMQFGKYPCEVATEEFLDPKLYGLDFSLRPFFTKESDYYSFSVMLFKSLLFVNPFGGVHKSYPNLLRRAQKRITIFDPQVKIPKFAVHYKVLPDEMLQYFHNMFAKDCRGSMSMDLLENIRWTKCTTCGLVHARDLCPQCSQKSPAAVIQTKVVNRKCVAEIIFRTKGRIMSPAVQYGKIKYLVEENGVVRRENGEKVFEGNPDNFTRFSIMGNQTLIGRKNRLIVLEKEKVVLETNTGTLGNLPVFESNDSEYCRLQGDMLIAGENKIIGNVLENQTWLKIGPRFGVGFYRVGKKTVAFIFNSRNPGINDDIKIPAIVGQLTDAECVFSETHALLLFSTMESGKAFNSMHLLSANGNLVASAKEKKDDSRMLSKIHNKTLGGDRIISANEDGLSLIKAEQGFFQETQLFSDTEPFVDEEMQIFSAPDGIYVVSEKEIKLLKLV
jgi:H/ACA ribonucleoprotein complex subunit 3